MKSLLSLGRANSASLLHLCWNSIRVLACCFIASSHIQPASAAQPQVATQFDFSSETTPGARKFYFETIPGHRYTLWRSTDLQNWAPVPGYPQTAAGLSIEHTFTQDVKEFFKVEPIDDQAPVVEAQYPAVDGFAVGRFADVSIELSDTTGIDPASIRLTVGASGQLAPGAPGLVISGNTITYDSGNAALGAWGVTLSATLIASDTLGHTLTHTWSFRLEPEPQTAANIFVFGSPTAQRSGQRVSGPAAALASRYPAPLGPQKANDPPPWSIDSVLGDRIVIAYQAGGMPNFTGGQLICNLAPTKESEIFYRRVISTNNDAANLKLTVMTSEVPLTDFASGGAAALSENSVVYELDANGVVVRALAVSGTLAFPPIGYDLSGSGFKLKTDGYEAKVKGVTYSSGSGMNLVKVTATEYSWWFTPRIRAGLELDWNGLKSFEAIASGQVSSSTVLDGEVLLAGVSVKRTLYDLPEASEPKTVIYLGNIGVVPVYATLGFDFLIKSKTDAKALLNFGVTYRQETSASFGLSYNRGSPLDWISAFQATSPDFGGSLGLTGEFSYELSFEPKIEFLVYGLAGISAGIEPKAELTASVSTNGGLGGKLEGSLDFVLAAAGPAFDLLNIEKELSYSIWEGEWPFVPQALVFKTQPISKTVVPGDNVSFTCTVDAPSPPSFQWYQNGQLLPGQTSRSLFLTYVNSGHAGNYMVRVKAGNQSLDSEIAVLTVQSPSAQTTDTDLDGVPDIYETNTGIWVSSTNHGTNPNRWDTDSDGLSDGVETNTRVYVSRSNTGTNPNQVDTDGDGVNDKREIDLGTDPNFSPSLHFLAVDSFHTGGTTNYATGALVGQAPLTVGFTGAWLAAYGGAGPPDVITTGLSYTDGTDDVNVSGGAIEYPFGGNGRAGRLLTSPYDNNTSGTVYFAVMIQPDSVGTGYRAFEMHSGGFDDAANRKLQIATGERGIGANDSHFVVRLFNNSTNGFAGDLGPADTNVNFFVGKINFSTTGGQDAISLWRNPSDLTSEAGSGAPTFSKAGFDLQIDRVSLARFNGADGFKADEIRFGGRWEDVVPIFYR